MLMPGAGKVSSRAIGTAARALMAGSGCGARGAGWDWGGLVAG